MKPSNKLELIDDLLQVGYELDYMYRKSIEFDRRIVELERLKFDLEDLLNEYEEIGKSENGGMAGNTGNNQYKL